jgi:hypothetical protein
MVGHRVADLGASDTSYNCASNRPDFVGKRN